MNVHFFRHGAAISNDPRLTEAEIAEERFLDALAPSDHGREQAGARSACSNATVESRMSP